MPRSGCRQEKAGLAHTHTLSLFLFFSQPIYRINLTITVRISPRSFFFSAAARSPIILSHSPLYDERPARERRGKRNEDTSALEMTGCLTSTGHNGHTKRSKVKDNAAKVLRQALLYNQLKQLLPLASLFEAVYDLCRLDVVKEETWEELGYSVRRRQQQYKSEAPGMNTME